MAGTNVGDFGYPAKQHEAVTPSDSVNISFVCRALFIGTAGNVAVVTEDGTAITYKNLSNGQILPVRTKRVNLSNTTAADIVALF